jgi:hypothetical protein
VIERRVQVRQQITVGAARADMGVRSTVPSAVERTLVGTTSLL